MIAGTIIIEDFTLHFHVLGNVEIDVTKPLQVRYTVCDNLSGHQESVQCAFEAFSTVLAVAMAPDSAFTVLADPDSYETAAAQVMPKAPNLRWMP